MLTVTLPYPISANRYWASRTVKPKGGPSFTTTYVTAEAKAYKEQVGWLLRASGVREPIKGRVAIAYTLYPKRPQDWQKRMRKLGAAWDDGVMCIDLDNAQKVLLDSMKGIAFEDDAWVRRILAERAEPDGEGRIVVTITAIETPAPQAELLTCADSQTGISASLFDPLEV
ncbi:RusA family crossover junction endodeoxyribonuclease [Paraburkholderia metrosideri]|uniref:RusA family crossover junction endodeoxyribonuclease n=1 Tax=Paraburkholderia metrosideri TaxID=580937 RepID=A0ABW9DSI5_9BURK